jgi:hypothetical protein
MKISKKVVDLVRQRAKYRCEYCHYPEFLSTSPLTDDFCLVFEPSFNLQLFSDSQRKRIKNSRLSLSEILTINILFKYSQRKMYWTLFY